MDAAFVALDCLGDWYKKVNDAESCCKMKLLGISQINFFTSPVVAKIIKKRAMINFTMSEFE